MLRSPNSPLDPHDAHLRNLLDQRATRADLHSRISSLSELSDTPSLYSHAFFSPQPAQHKGDIDMSSNLASPISAHSTVLEDRNRLNDLAVSMLDMDDDSRSSFAESSYDDYDDRHSSEAVDEDDDPSMPRMSLLGPKMRFHSKAPWELEDNPLQEEESEDDMDQQSILSSSTRGKGGASRHFGFGGSKLGSRGRTSRDSSRSRRTERLPLETASSQVFNPRGALHTLAQASMSSTSLGLPGAGSMRQPFSLSSARPQSPSSPSSPTSPRSPVHFSDMGEDRQMPRASTAARSLGSDDSQVRPSFAYSVEELHPYANPDLVGVHTSGTTQKFTFPAVPRSDSSTTVTESSSSGSGPKSVASRPSMTTDFSGVTPQSPRLQAFITQGREISSPMSVRSSALPGRDRENVSLAPPQPSGLPGWTDRAASPAFNLITLEEARAQRSHGSTSHTHPLSHNTQGSGGTPAGTNAFAEEYQNLANSTPSRVRARSISAGARAKQALNNIVGNTPPKAERRDSEPAIVHNQVLNGGPQVKSLKHKKSGFMRLFNGNRDEKSLPPPVPSLSEGFAAFNAQQAAPRMPKVNRIPVPQISPSLLEDKQLDELTAIPKPSPSPKRTPPPLNLSGASRLTDSLHPGSIADMTKSAPANVTRFPALKLRPISSTFSAQFGEHILTSPASDCDPDTPSSESPSTVISPVTPGLFNRHEQTSDRKMSSSDSAEDQSAIIRALQDQIVNAKRAWQRQIWELEGQVRDLKAEVEELRASEGEKSVCELCGRESSTSQENSQSADKSSEQKPLSVVNRPRARTGTGQSRFGSAV